MERELAKVTIHPSSEAWAKREWALQRREEREAREAEQATLRWWLRHDAPRAFGTLFMWLLFIAFVAGFVWIATVLQAN
jgi:hypothetical protein